jgi:hypothetical protein
MLSTISHTCLGLAPSAMPTRTTTPTMAFKTDTPRPDLQSGLDFTWDKPWTSNEISDKAGLQALAKKLNPIVGYWGARSTPREAAWPIPIGRPPRSPRRRRHSLDAAERGGWMQHLMARVVGDSPCGSLTCARMRLHF